jgi:putative radical SAM enzyme (TIGR03279 family)
VGNGADAGGFVCVSYKEHKIDRIDPGSIAEEMEIEAGDVLISVNGKEIEDVFDYHYLIHDEYLVVVIRKPDGEEWELEIEKDYDEDLGIEFENGLMDDYKSCHNKCIFCFIDQMPKGMRETLYFKDDDSRLSFLQGNYVTLTNMKDKDLNRIIEYKLAPINISVQTTNPTLRCMMLNNRFAGDALKKIDRLYEAGIEMNGQIVLCKGVNDGEELERSIRDLTKYLPYMESVSVVPVGLSKFREGLYPLEPFTKEDACQVLDTIHKWQQVCVKSHGTHFIHASDEWYLLAERELPDEDNYDGYIQLENGVGMIRLLLNEFREALSNLLADVKDKEIPQEMLKELAREHEISLATGRLAAPFLTILSEELMAQFPNYHIRVYTIRNDFFGERITVSGLLTGQDLEAQLKEQKLGERLLLPCNLLRSGENVFLDDMTLEELENTLQVPIDIVKSSGQDLLDAMLCID